MKDDKMAGDKMEKKHDNCKMDERKNKALGPTSGEAGATTRLPDS